MKKARSLKVIALVITVFTVIQMLGMIGVGAAGANRTEIEIPDGKQAIYTAKIERAHTDRVAIKLGNTEMVSITSGAMKICEAVVQGKYTEGVYYVKMYINPAQQMYTVELTLPDGGIVVRGTSEIEDYSNVSVSATKNYIVSDATVVYEDVTVADYTISETEPEARKNFYNFVSSFNDASSTDKTRQAQKVVKIDALEVWLTISSLVKCSF